MIFKSVLKYKIIEWCLNTMVNKLLENLLIKPMDISGLIRVEDLRLGMRLSKIELEGNLSGDYGWDVFKDCEILSVSSVSIRNNFYIVKFTYRFISNIGANLKGYEDINKDITNNEIENEFGYSVNWIVDPSDQRDSRFYI